MSCLKLNALMPSVLPVSYTSPFFSLTHPTHTVHNNGESAFASSKSYPMAANLEEPGRTRALRSIHKALQYRNLTRPRANIPLTVPFLAHDDFTKHTQQWLRTTIQQRKRLAILHLPTHRLRPRLYALNSTTTRDGRTASILPQIQPIYPAISAPSCWIPPAPLQTATTFLLLTSCNSHLTCASF